ncbi:MAG TPA: SRPBCC family protein [Solirubrobacteraceae bacterium]|nr:SRPBCC family protein [Solirubrobacteraceae bacterium]
MIDFTIETRIERAPREVFDFVTDPEQLPSWQTNTVSAEPEPAGPLALGSRIREVHKGPGGKDVESLVEVSEFEPGRLFALKMVEGSLPVDARIELEGAGSGTLMRFAVHGELSGVMRLAQPMLSLGLRRQFEQHCANLKRVLEGG